MPEAPVVRWVGGILTQKCRGDGPAGLFKFEVGFPPVMSREEPEPRPQRDFARSADWRVFSSSIRPPIPPPRVS